MPLAPVTSWLRCCGQVHNFSHVDNVPKPLRGDLGYLVKKDLKCNSTKAAPCDYLPRLVRQSWEVDYFLSAHLINYNNTAAEMHYADDWYVVSVPMRRQPERSSSPQQRTFSN